MRPVPRFIVQQLRLGILTVAFETRALNFRVVFENIITNQTKNLVCRLRISLENHIRHGAEIKHVVRPTIN